MKKWSIVFLLVALVSFSSWTCFNYYPYLFSRAVLGQIIRVDRVDAMNAKTAFVISIRDDKSREIFTATTSDRQWAIASSKYCAKAVLFRYPPWDMERSGLYFGARLKRLYECTDLRN